MPFTTGNIFRAKAPNGTSLQGIPQSLIGVVLGLGLVARGYALWSEKGAMAMQPKAAM